MKKLMNETLVYINYLERKMEMEKTEFGLEQDGSDPRIAVFDELWSKGWITGDPIVVAREMDIPEEYIQSFIEWYVELDDLEYTPWIEKYNSNKELEMLEGLVSSTNPYREAPKKEGFSPEYIRFMESCL